MRNYRFALSLLNYPDEIDQSEATKLIDLLAGDYTGVADMDTTPVIHTYE